MNTKKIRKQIKRTTKSLRKALKRGGKPLGVATGALTLGGLAAVVAFDPEIRERSRVFAGAARDFFLRAGRQAKEPLQSEAPRLEVTH
ncbi:MAG TPA: hypothetical protein VFX59_01500 [Polyangiales bacterium]|nr:hypothetical protein [Polyangiales bacterium]